MTEIQERFVARALRRKRLFLVLSFTGLVIALALAFYYGYCRLHDPLYPVGPRLVIVVLILLNSRQNLRQYRFATVIENYKSKGV